MLKRTGGGRDGETGKGREDLEKDKTKSKRNGISGRTPGVILVTARLGGGEEWKRSKETT